MKEPLQFEQSVAFWFPLEGVARMTQTGEDIGTDKEYSN